MPDSPFHRLLAKAKNVARRPRGWVRRHISNAGSTESLPPAIDREQESGPFAVKNTNVASSYESLPIPSRTTQVYHAEPQETEIISPVGGSRATPSVSSQFIGTLPTSSRQSLSTTIIPTPWEAWTLDQDFLSQVYTWNATHPENTLDRILNTTSTLIERHDVLLELVPDGPIPFRGFVKALAHLVKLGTAIAEAKAVALDFAQDVLHWVEKLAAAFGDSEDGHFISKAWANLADIRKLIDEVCIWAHRMLTKSGLAERVSVKNTILGFREHFTQAIERFGVASHIHIAIGQDRLNKHLDNLAVGQGHTHQELETIKQLVQMAPKRQPTIPLPTYQIQKKIPCDPGTRKQVLDEIMKWIFDTSDSSPCFFWLSGDPGVGKSAVTASIARECMRRKVLWAQYFINRNDAQTVDPQLYFPTIAKQMAACEPAVDHAVQKTLRDHPYLLNDDISLEQATKLFVDMIHVAAAATPTLPVAVVIDALDETDYKRLKVTAEIFSRVLVDLPRNAKVFISSRVETVIRDNFADLPRVRNIHLSARNSIPDVTAYLEAKVNEIMKEHHISWSRWGKDRMRKLCSQASGLFIWAVTAVKYIQAQIEDFGTARLDIVLDELNANGMQDMDTLYMAILKRTYLRDTPWQNQCFQRIVGAILAQQTPLSIDDLAGLLNLHDPSNNAPVDVEHFVRRLRTILVQGVDEITGRTIPRVHKSFADFITSTKANQFCVNLTHSNGELALQCIDQLEHLWTGQDHQIPGQLDYAIAHWSSHLTQVVGVAVDTPETDDDTASIDDSHSLVLDLEKEPAPTAPVKPRSKENVSTDDLNSISISPDRTCLVYTYSYSIMLRDIQTGAYREVSFKGHTMDVNTAVFSSDGRYIVSASDDQTVRIWDATTGEPAGQPLKGHTQFVYSAFFSPDGRQIVSASTDGTVRIWDANTSEMVHVISTSNPVNSVCLAVFSPDARHVVSFSSPDACVWDAATGQAVQALPRHNFGAVAHSSFFSPDGKNILSYYRDGDIAAWDSETGQKLPEIFSVTGFPNPSLSFIGLETGSALYITTPPITTPPDGTQSSYLFRVAEDGIAGGIGGTWLYANQRKDFGMGIYLGQLIIFRTFL